ncbi:hypothetical protein E2C01_068869 [Portunus trituberculatus]|uniref:Uncharacterized protein n=1 Tax=Portunus trituberculatus TaxID=210409 RepID=A0A5B7HXV8_PORTR|nr:hypothetical protein [Portunus trituberculatus]
MSSSCVSRVFVGNGERARLPSCSGNMWRCYAEGVSVTWALIVTLYVPNTLTPILLPYTTPRLPLPPSPPYPPPP